MAITIPLIIFIFMIRNNIKVKLIHDDPSYYLVKDIGDHII